MQIIKMATSRQTTTTNNSNKTKNRKYQGVEGMWRNWNACALLVGMLNGTPAMENTIVLKKVKHGISV
jgi:hypothetical protein